jgi:hypothetical protein
MPAGVRVWRSIHKPDELLAAAYALAREIADNTAPVKRSTASKLGRESLFSADSSKARLPAEQAAAMAFLKPTRGALCNLG